MWSRLLCWIGRHRHEIVRLFEVPGAHGGVEYAIKALVCRRCSTAYFRYVGSRPESHKHHFELTYHRIMENWRVEQSRLDDVEAAIEEATAAAWENLDQ